MAALYAPACYTLYIGQETKS
uniref:Uncharacterized protein n=1 Tax=Anguilla anguilla TaxID=7936 RepID=A0A0E9RL57_ANGAN